MIVKHRADTFEELLIILNEIKETYGTNIKWVGYDDGSLILECVDQKITIFIDNKDSI